MPAPVTAIPFSSSSARVSSSASGPKSYMWLLAIVTASKPQSVKICAISGGWRPCGATLARRCRAIGILALAVARSAGRRSASVGPHELACSARSGNPSAGPCTGPQSPVPMKVTSCDMCVALLVPGYDSSLDDLGRVRGALEIPDRCDCAIDVRRGHRLRRERHAVAELRLQRLPADRVLRVARHARRPVLEAPAVLRHDLDRRPRDVGRAALCR